VQVENANHTESIGDAQEKPARSYKLEFAPNLELTLVDPLIRNVFMMKTNERKNLVEKRSN
jgi:hypothetical protein